MSHLVPYEDTEHVRNMTEEVNETSLTKTHSAESLRGKKNVCSTERRIRYYVYQNMRWHCEAFPGKEGQRDRKREREARERGGEGVRERAWVQ